ncbi:hypothetical protein ACIGXM_05805 [Kitasatospora sp. NPDC052896]|uniref:hypothetical protein n=1 Tax=Kitasatospora sp. NPDC052896 TaxID=3364061 RepID=UPI0037C7E4F2
MITPSVAMPANQQPGGALRWFVTAAGRYVLACTAFWLALAATAALLTELHTDSGWTQLPNLIRRGIPMLAGISIPLLLLVIPIRYTKESRAMAGLVLSFPLICLMFLFGPALLLVALIAFQAAFAWWGLPTRRPGATGNR